MLFQLGGEGSRPTFFEMDAADKLQNGLKSALLYSLGVICFVLHNLESASGKHDDDHLQSFTDSYINFDALDLYPDTQISKQDWVHAG